MKHPIRLSLLLCISILAGCATQGVPKTVLTFDPATGKVTYEGPKQFKSSGFSTELTKNGNNLTVKVRWDTLAAENDPSVIEQSGTADAQRITATAGLVKEVGTTINTSLGTALGAAAKTAVPVP